MAITLPNVIEHNNPVLKIVDSNFVKGGGRIVADLTALYALATYADQLKEMVTRVYVTAETKYYTLTDDANIGNSAGWTAESAIVLTFTYTKASAATTWIIAHTLNCFPKVLVLDSSAGICEGEIVYDSVNQLTLTFSAAISGTAYLTS